MFVQFEGNYILEKLICRLHFLYLLNRRRLRLRIGIITGLFDRKSEYRIALFQNA